MNAHRYSKWLVAAVIVSASASAFAGWGDALKGALKIGGDSSSSSLDAGSLISNGLKATKEVSEEEEIILGEEFASNLLGAKPLVDNPALQRYVNTLGRWIAMQSDRPDLPWTFGVLDDNGFNAFATPGGYVFVTKGLIARMHNEAELAGVLAHEIAHVQQKHHLKAVKSNAGFAVFGDVVGGLAKGNEQLKSFAKNAVKNLYAKGLDKGDEYEADRVGVVLAARAGYDAYALPSVLQMLQAQNGSDNDFSLMFKTHPSPALRIDQLDKLMDKRFDGLPGSQGKTIAERLEEFNKVASAKKK